MTTYPELITSSEEAFEEAMKAWAAGHRLIKRGHRSLDTRDALMDRCFELRSDEACNRYALNEWSSPLRPKVKSPCGSTYDRR